LIFVETPANPTNALIDLEMCKEIANHFKTESNSPIVAVDNTYMGPLWCQPLDLGADLVIYSATKYIGGHSDLIAGAVLGNQELMTRIKVLRTFLGNMTGPWTGWLLMRSLETLKPRMELQAANAAKIADFLLDHPKVEKVYYLGHLKPGSKMHQIFEKQYSSPGAMISVDIKGGEKEAFTFLNNLKLFHLAVSLGSTESLAQHPYSMTHADVSEIEKNALGLTNKMVRLSIGVENADDLIWDISQALI
jgi:methionine-gamma-lyase